MSGRQAKLARREIRRSAAPALRTMQEQQEGAIMSCIQRVNELTLAVDVMRATVHNLGKRVDALQEPPPESIPVTLTNRVDTHYELRPQDGFVPCAVDATFGPDGDSRPLEAE